MSAHCNTPQQCNTLHNGSWLRDTAPASAYATLPLSINEKNPDQEEPVVEPLCDDQEWEYLLTERVGIILDGENLTSAASALALADTTHNHGHLRGVKR